MQEDIESDDAPRGFMDTRAVRILGAVAFIAGLLLATLSGWLWPTSGQLAATIVVLGVLVGFLNITGREVIPFLVAAVALVIIGRGDIFKPLDNFATGLGTTVDAMVNQIALFAAPAALVNAVRVAIALGRPGRRL